MVLLSMVAIDDRRQLLWLRNSLPAWPARCASRLLRISVFACHQPMKPGNHAVFRVFSLLDPSTVALHVLPAGILLLRSRRCALALRTVPLDPAPRRFGCPRLRRTSDSCRRCRLSTSCLVAGTFGRGWAARRVRCALYRSRAAARPVGILRRRRIRRRLHEITGLRHISLLPLHIHHTHRIERRNIRRLIVDGPRNHRNRSRLRRNRNNPYSDRFRPAFRLILRLIFLFAFLIARIARSLRIDRIASHSYSPIKNPPQEGGFCLFPLSDVPDRG